ncbi:hypothetical protein P152DRAFT_414381 [Eremomyces bilateralis CBS 781.70]|uniref:SWI/SNF family DNA-dependent ATPase Ris1 n=1 Tax=Eremomyces bilateralis CBS 781.70 TaxID=1392243 RepID=A0A6G1G776_9PEZI|nr:uncharacterized protein P152DRAFT_414381 [Eremomyces bilateralis CBS 781.70]KAF1813903.1 hypothetical protein P152DRAFT_414381 [Eremomyces bilateralis CBS 781.70]
MASSLGPNPSVEDIEDEIILLDSLLESLESGSIDYDRLQWKYEKERQELLNLLSETENQDAEIGNPRATASPHPPSTEQTSRKRSLDDDDRSIPGAYPVSKSRRTSGGSSGANSPTSVDSLGSIPGLRQPGTPGSQRALQRQRDRFESAEKGRLQRRLDEEFAKSLQSEDIRARNGGDSHPGATTTPGPHMAIQDWARPPPRSFDDPFTDLMELPNRQGQTDRNTYLNVYPPPPPPQDTPFIRTSGGFMNPSDAIHTLVNRAPSLKQENPWAQYPNAASSSRNDPPWPPPDYDPYGRGMLPWQREIHDDLYGAAQVNSAEEQKHLQSLMGNIESIDDVPIHDRDQTPREMDCTLYEHQKIGLFWLRKMETGSNKGGILADDMGLGKTIQIIALMVTRPSDDPAQKTNLIVAPVALLEQWKGEIERLVKRRFRLSIFIHHGQSRAKSFETLRSYDVVLTTYGQLTEDRKRLLLRQKALENNPRVKLTPQATPVLMGPNCKWYRIVLDEAQNIKNKDTKASIAASELRARYRFCVTGTPMMNRVSEAYSLIRFLRIPPYDQWNSFKLAFHSKLQLGNWDSTVMERFQAVLRAMLLRRTKKTKIDGRPIDETLPDRVIHTDHFVFRDDEKEFYKNVETHNKEKFQGYMDRGEVESNYMAILVLLLRLRQACCHPLLIKDLSFEPATDLSEEDLATFAAKLTPEAVQRVKNSNGNFICPICLDATRNPALLVPCGHEMCSDCLSKFVADSNSTDDEDVNVLCPQCRISFNPKQVTDYGAFLKEYMPEEPPQDTAAPIGSDDDDSDESDDESGTNSLDGFIVPDDEDDGDIDEEAKGRKNKGKSKKKGKSRASKKKLRDMTLGELAKESRRNARAKSKYIRRLRKMWRTSSKIEKTLEILTETYQKDPTEKTIIFSQWTSLLDLLEIPLKDHGYRYLRYDGGMTSTERATTISKFMRRDDCNVILVSLKAGNAGLNLTRASQVIILDPFWNPFIEEQAIDRAHRIGQRRVVHVHRLLVQESVEDRIIEVQEQKREQINAALDERAASKIPRLGRRELAYIFGVTDGI